MNIDWTNFTPWASLGGGLLIGLAASVLLLFNGRIAGISGILGGLFRPTREEVAWRLAFVGGLMGAGLLFGALAPPTGADAGTSLQLLVVAGLLVGLGTRYGAGCTSGHGVCGLARRSPRSLAATIAFMGAGFVTVYLVRHVVA